MTNVELLDTVSFGSLSGGSPAGSSGGMLPGAGGFGMPSSAAAPAATASLDAAYGQLGMGDLYGNTGGSTGYVAPDLSAPAAGGTDGSMLA